MSAASSPACAWSTQAGRRLRDGLCYATSSHLAFNHVGPASGGQRCARCTIPLVATYYKWHDSGQAVAGACVLAASEGRTL